jgi:hypothetical protein
MDTQRVVSKHDLELCKAELEDVVGYWFVRGVVVTVEQKPLQPLAMGRYETVVSVRAAREVQS